MSYVYCPECGFQNPEAANYCAKCGALLAKDEAGAETTMTYVPDEGDDDAGALEDMGVKVIVVSPLSSFTSSAPHLAQ